jgi:chromosome segregation protein
VLRLTKLQILGFKSFSDRTDVQFPGEGIAAIVGPNGCGKSNIADALNWVLGEQSAKSLRGGKMEDVIFSGTPARRPTGMAEVSITLVDTDVYPSFSQSTPQLQIVTSVTAEADHADWDETASRTESLRDTEAAVAAVQPGPAETDSETEGVEAADTGVDGVVLRIRRRKFEQIQRAGEVVVTRRLFRTGESEYLLNGKLCRLRDIQDIFMGTGLGPESYAIIEQERISQLLSSKPHDRRSIIEEAAGITRFKTKKRLAELRLEQSRQNLARVHDIFEEVTRQMNSLKRQASKAERHAALNAELKSRNRVVLASKLAVFDSDSAVTAGLLQENSAELDTKIVHVDNVESDHSANVTQRYALESAAREAGEAAANAAMQLERTISRRQHNQERIAELELRETDRQGELARQREHQAVVAGELEEHRAFLESAATDSAAMRGQHQSAKQHEQELGVAVAQTAQLMEDGRRRSVQLLTAEGQLRNQQAQSEESLAAMQRDSQRLTHESRVARDELATLGAERGQISLAFDTAGEWLESLEREVAAAQAGLQAARERENETKSRLDSSRAEHAAVQGRAKSLDAMIREHSYSTDTVRQIFREGGAAGLETVGTLADYLEVDGQYEGVVDEFLREELNYVVVKSWHAAEEGMRLLRQDVDGRATFLVHPHDSQAKFSFAMEHEPPQHRAEDGVFRLKDKIRVLDGFGRSLEVILPKLRDGYVTPDAGMARNLALENPHAFFLSPTGECFHNVTVTGGRPRAEGPLALKRELREAQVRLESLASEVAQLEMTAATLKAEIGDLTARVEVLQTERRQAEKAHATSNAGLQRVEAEVSRLEARLAEWSLQLARLAEARQQREEQIQARGQEIAALEVERGNVEAAVGEAQHRSEDARQRRMQAQEEASALAIRLAALEERHRGAAAQHERTARVHQDITRRIQESELQQAASATEKLERGTESEALAREEISLAEVREQATQQTALLAEESTALRTRMAEQEQALKELRAQADALREQRGELQASAARLAAECQHLEAACIAEISEDASLLRADESIARLEAEPLAQEEAETRAIRQRMDAMGPVNPMALIEYNEVAERHGFLETQRRDLMESIDNTQASIREIDEVTRQKFDEAFVRINENFGKTFTRMFGGGVAQMRLTDAENPAESGIDIVASPPGKKMQSVLLLSGGEKALTALSLLVGIFLYQPSPFCVLDEVDAPLDEANIKRFAGLLRDMAATTQFIQITHSKLSMQNADQIFGVTMQEPGVSKIVSVKLGGREMARAIA